MPLSRQAIGVSFHTCLDNEGTFPKPVLCPRLDPVCSQRPAEGHLVMAGLPADQTVSNTGQKRLPALVPTSTPHHGSGFRDMISPPPQTLSLSAFFLH